MSDNERIVHFIDETSVPDVDEIIFGTGYSWSLPFLPNISVRKNGVPGLYQHVVYRADPTSVFVSAVGAGLTFKVFEWQAVLAARVLSGRAMLPSVEEQARCEKERFAEKGDGPLFTLISRTLRHILRSYGVWRGNRGKEVQGGSCRRLSKSGWMFL